MSLKSLVTVYVYVILKKAKAFVFFGSLIPGAVSNVIFNKTEPKLSFSKFVVLQTVCVRQTSVLEEFDDDFIFLSADFSL